MKSATANQRLIRAAGLAAVAVFLGLVARFWHPVYGFTALLQLDASNDHNKIAAFRELPVYVYKNTGGYDGLYYAQIAYHPALRDPELAPAIDNLSYRARRILVPALAWLLAGGNPKWIVHVYSLFNVAAWLALAGLLWRLLEVNDRRSWIAWAGLMFSAGALSSVRFALTDLAALTLVTGAFLLVERASHYGGLGVLAAASLARETSLVAVPGLWEPPWISWRNVSRTFLVGAPFALWLGYIRWRVGPLDVGSGNFGWPVASLVRKWGADLMASSSLELHALALTTLLATLALTVQAVFFLVRWRPADLWWRVGAAHSAFMLCLGGAVWEGFPGAATRVMLPLNLAFNVFAVRTRAPLVWLLLGNLTVFSGLLTMNFLPYDGPLELVARGNGVIYQARFNEGWFGRESNWRRAWTWSDGHGSVSVTSSPATSRSLRLEFETRSLAPCTVTIRQGGRQIWRGAVGTERTPASAVVQLVDGRAVLTFSTDTPGTMENSKPGARLLAFAVYDPRLTLPDTPR